MSAKYLPCLSAWLYRKVQVSPSPFLKRKLSSESRLFIRNTFEKCYKWLEFISIPVQDTSEHGHYDILIVDIKHSLYIVSLIL